MSIDALTDICLNEWDFFDRGEIRLNGTSKRGKQEYEDGAWQRVGDYWKVIGGGFGNLNGKDRGKPWSAAFISFCMNEAGAGADFPISPGHYKYINESIRNAGKSKAPIIGHKPKEYSLKVGDLIGYWRGEKKITFENARRIGWYQSHTDIVVEINGNKAFVIGGNVSNSVTLREVRLNDQGHLVDRQKNWFVIIENNISFNPSKKNSLSYKARINS